MKKVLLVLFIVIAGIIISNAQNSENILPASFSNELMGDDYDYIFFSKPDIDKLIAEDTFRDKNGEFFRTGVAVLANLNIYNTGTWTQADNGKIWRLKIIADKAMGIALDINNFFLPEGSNLFFYNEAHTQIYGPYTYSDNTGKMVFASDIVDGEVINIELFIPKEYENQATLNIADISYIYRGIKKDVKVNESDPCEVNINCPEGDNWQDEKRGVAKLYLRVGTEYGYCSGSLINNQLQNCTTYLLTADHCGLGASVSDLAWWRFYFNYETDSCENPTIAPSSNMTYGCELIASGGNGGSNGSDFFLVKLDRTSFPTDWNLYFNGWDRSTTASGGGVSIHHPNADIKKISTYTNTPTSSTWGSVPNTHWRIYWASTVTNKGVTEGGSSGSPLFNNSGRIIGDLTGGGSYCTASTYPDYYGKFSYSWESNGTTDNKKLKPWLDPDNTGITVLDGKNYNDCPSGISDRKSNTQILNIFPNPAKDQITISVPELNEDLEISVSIYDIEGRLLFKESFVAKEEKNHIINISELINGTYNLKMILNDETFNEKFVIIR